MIVTPEQRLFRKVIEQAIRDVTYVGRSVKMIEARDEAILWFWEADRDFQITCVMAGLDPDAVHDRYLAGSFDRSMIERLDGSSDHS